MDIKVPSVGESITSGILGAWKIADGDYVQSGATLLEIETDKVTSEVYAEASGTVKHLAKEGEEVQIGQVIGEIDEAAKPPAKKSEVRSQDSGEKKQESSRKEKEDKTESPQPPVTRSQSAATASTESKSPESENPEPATRNSQQATETLSPAVRRLVEEHHLDPAAIQGTGKEGRILKADVLNVVESGQPSAVRSTPPATRNPQPATADSDRVSVTKMSPLRRKIADRLVAAQHTAAMLTTFNEADLSTLIALRKRHQDAFVRAHGVKLGFMSLFAKAVIHALKAVPALNARLEGDSIIRNHYYDLGIAMSTDRGLMVPVVRDCDRLSLAGIEKEIIAYGEKAKEGKIQLTDLEGGVFTITNGGIFGSLLSTPILNPPQSGILGMHAIQERPVAVDGQVVIRPMMYLALTYDHRIVDGREAVTFLVKVKEWVENPAVELLEL